MTRSIPRRIDHSTHDHPATKVARAICRKAGMVEAEKAFKATVDPTKVKVYNIDSGDRVEVHSTSCADPRKKDAHADHYTIEATSVHTVWEDYNADFIAERDAAIEEGEDGDGFTHTIYVYKCTGLVNKMTEYNA